MNNINIYLVNYQNLNFVQNYQKYFKYLSKKELNKIKNNAVLDQVRSIVGLLFIKGFAAKNNFKLNLQKNKYGKPYLIDKNFYFNISHSNEITVIGISNNDLGIDLEYIEKESLTFYKDWTTKESFFKLIGKGLSMYNDKYEINFDNNQILYKNKNYYFKNYLINNYLLTVSTKTKSKINIKYLTNIELIELISNLKPVI